MTRQDIIYRLRACNAGRKGEYTLYRWGGHIIATTGEEHIEILPSGAVSMNTPNPEALIQKFESMKKETVGIDFQMLDDHEIMGKKIVDVHLHTDTDGQTLEIMLDDGKQIEISFNAVENEIMVQSD